MRNTRIRLGLSLALSLAIIVGASYWVTGTMDGIYAYRSPLKDAPPTAGLSANPTLTRRVVLVLVDGLRADTAQDAAVMPVLAGLRAAGASAVMHSQPASFSQPGYATLLTGAWPDINDGPAVNLDTDLIPTLTQDTLYAAAQRAGLSTAVSGYFWFEKLLPQKQVSFHFYTPGEDAAADREVVDSALPWLRANQGQLVLFHIDQVDYAGHHEGGPNDPRWNEAAARSDALLGEILSAVDLAQDTLLVVSDHGHIDQGGHGGTETMTLTEPFVLAGKGIRPGQYPDVQMVDVAPTLAALLGAGLPSSSQGQPLTAMLGISPADQSTLESAFQDQQTRLADDYRLAIGMQPPAWTDTTTGAAGISAAHAARLARERWPRAILTLFIALAVGRLVFGSLPGWGTRLLAGLIYLLVFVLGYLLVSNKTFTLSSVTGVSDLLVTAGGWTLAGALGAGVFFAWRAALDVRSPRQASASLLEMIMTVAFLLLLPILVSFTLNGYQPEWTLPEFNSAFASVVSAVQLLVCGVLGVLLAGVGLLARK